MKTLFATLALIAASLTVSQAAAPATDPKEAARTTYSINVFPAKAENMLNVLLEKSASKRLTVFLKNDKGQTVYEETVGKKVRSFARRLNLAALPEGRYTLTVSDGETQLRKSIDLAAAQPSQRGVSVQ